MTTHNITFITTTTFDLTPEFRAKILTVFHKIKGGESHGWPPAFIEACEKIDATADEEFIVSTILGEVTGSAIRYELPNYQHPALGFLIKSVEFVQTPTKLPLPENAVPQIVKLGDRSIH